MYLFLKQALPLVVILFLISCGDKAEVVGSSAQTIQQLTQLLSSKEEFINALNKEMDEINTALSQIDESNGDDLDSVSNPVDKIRHFDALLTESKNKVDVLEKRQVNVASNSEKELLTSIINNLKNTLKEKEEYIARLRSENETLASSNTNLQASLSQANNSIFESTELIKQKQDEIKKLEVEFESEKKLFLREKDNMKDELTKAKESVDQEKSNAYFEIALTLKQEFDNTKSGALQTSKNKMRKELINNAYEYFRKACLLGNKSSPSYIRILLTEEVYTKELTIKRSNSAISNCGI